MEFWRRWRLLSVIALVGAVSSGALGAALDDEVAALESAKGTAAVTAREAIVGPSKSMSLVSRDSYGATVAGKLAPLLAKPDVSVDARLNAAIAIAEMHTLSTDNSLEGMLKSGAPEVRYWGAKGLGGIMPDLQKVGGSSLRNAVTGLLTALKVEKSGIVKTQMVEAIGKTNDVSMDLQAVDILGAQIAAGTTDSATLDAAAGSLTQLDAAIRGAGALSKADAAAAAKSVAWMASYAAQEQVALSEKSTAEQSEMPDGYASSTANVVSAAVKVLNDLAGHGTFKAPAGDESPDALQLMVDGLTGTPSTGQGELQKVMPDVPVPPAIKK